MQFRIFSDVLSPMWSSIAWIKINKTHSNDVSAKQKNNKYHAFMAVLLISSRQTLASLNAKMFSFESNLLLKPHHCIYDRRYICEYFFSLTFYRCLHALRHRLNHSHWAISSFLPFNVEAQDAASEIRWPVWSQ